jgi:hypothetical protein
VAGEIIGGELRRHAAPAECQSGPDHRHLRARVSEQAQKVGHEAGQAEAEEHERDRQLLGGVGGRARRCEHAGADHSHDDRAHRGVLVAPGVLAQHPLGDEHQHEQAGCEGGLNDDERGQQERHDLQRPAEDRHPGAEQPARPPHEPPRERQAQMLVVWRLLGVHRLQGDP